MPKLPSPYTPAIESAIYKYQPSDFIVNEKLSIDFNHAGEHLWVHIQMAEECLRVQATA